MAVPVFLPILLLTAQAVPATTAAPNVASESTTTAAKQELRTAIGAILRGQGSNARTTLQSIAAVDLDTKDQALRTCALSRLDAATPLPSMSELPADHRFARDLLTLYRAYWRDSAMNEAERSISEKALVDGLGKLLGRSMADVPSAEPLIAARLHAAGLFSQQGRTGVFHDLMIWRRETQKTEEVALPEGSNATQVNYLDEFISRGWSSYFTCERIGTGGWATGNGLFVIVPSYDSLTDENFRVNFLAHESQHYSDMKRFGDLPQWRLEYRAKLVEVAYADTTIVKVLNSFASNQGEDPADPHSYANKRVLEALGDRLGTTAVDELRAVPVDQLNEAARSALKADSAALDMERHTASKQ
jgi:hypothetical protein